MQNVKYNERGFRDRDPLFILNNIAGVLQTVACDYMLVYKYLNFTNFAFFIMAGNELTPDSI